MRKQFSSHLIKKVLIIGYNTRGICVYNSFLSFNDYEFDSHPWEDPIFVKASGINLLHGYVFDDNGKLIQEFENSYLTDGTYDSGWTRDDQGVILRSSSKARAT